MAERSLRGASIGAQSIETEDGVVFAQRFRWDYICPNGHEFYVAFSVEADVPTTWECKECSAKATISSQEMVDDMRNFKQQRTHWDMLCERRSLEELEELIAERIEQYRSGEALFEDE